MANNFPVLPAMQVASLQYHVNIAEIGGAAATMPPGDLDLIYTTFGINNGDGTQSFDYTKFDQDAHEAAMRQMLNALSNVMAGNLGVAPAVVQAGITVQRTWLFSAGTQIGGAYPGYTLTDTMTYP